MEKLKIGTTAPRVEINFYRTGPEAYLTQIAKELDYSLNKAGGIGPYEYSCGPFRGNPDAVMFMATEL